MLYQSTQDKFSKNGVLGFCQACVLPTVMCVPTYWGAQLRLRIHDCAFKAGPTAYDGTFKVGPICGVMPMVDPENWAF